MKSKKLIHRILIIFFAIFFTCYSSLYAFSVPVLASSMPNPSGQIDPQILQQIIQNSVITKTLQELTNSIPSPSEPIELPSNQLAHQYGVYAMEAALMQWAEPGGTYDNIVATEDLASRMCNDFINEYGDDVFRVAVVQPGDMVKQIFWDAPYDACGAILNATDAGMFVLADEYVSLSDSLVSKIKEFFDEHIKHGVYYSEVPEGKFNKIYKLEKDVYYNCLDEPTGRLWDYYGTSLNGYVFGELNPNGTTIYFHDTANLQISYRLSTPVNGSYSHYSWYNYPGVGHCAGTNIPVFATYPDTTQDNWWKQAENWIEIDPNIITPVTNPIPLECPDIYHLPEVYPYFQSVPGTSLDPAVEPLTDPDGYPIPSPDPVTVPSPVPTPEPIIVPDPVKPDPNPNPDPDPNPNPNPDPDPNPNPDPNPEDPDPDPEDPDPEEDDDEGDMVFDLSEFFPFCLPYDLYLAFHMLSIDDETEYFSYFGGDSHLGVEYDYSELDKSDPDALVFDIPMNFHLSGLSQNDLEYNFKIDIIHPVYDDQPGAEPYVKYLRFFLLFLYIIFLIFATIKLIPR